MISYHVGTWLPRGFGRLRNCNRRYLFSVHGVSGCAVCSGREHLDHSSSVQFRGSSIRARATVCRHIALSDSSQVRLAKGIRQASHAEVVFNVVLSAVILLTGMQRLRICSSPCFGSRSPSPCESVLCFRVGQDDSQSRCGPEILGWHFHSDLRALSSVGGAPPGLDSVFDIRQLDQPSLGHPVCVLLCEVADADQEMERSFRNKQ